MINRAAGTLNHWIERSGFFGSDSYPLPGLPLQSDQLRVRGFRREDEKRRQEWAKFRDPYLQKYNFTPRRTLENDVTYQKLKDRIRLAVDNSDRELIGYLAFKPLQKDPGAAELGICFAADQVSNGHGYETLRLTLPWACDILNLNRVFLEVDEINVRAVRLYLRLGFVKIAERWYHDRHTARLKLSHPLPAAEGVRYQKNKIELLSWKMEWKNDELDRSGFS